MCDDGCCCSEVQACVLHCVVDLLVSSSKGACDGCSLGLWCPQVSDRGEHAHGLTAHDTLVARRVLWRGEGRGRGREGGNGIVEEEVSRRRGTAVPTVITILCTNIQHCIEHVVQTNL